MKKAYLLFFLLLAGCASASGLPPTQRPVLGGKLAQTVVSTATPALPSTFSPPLTPLPEPSSTPVLVMQGPDAVFCPILLYHRIAIPLKPSEYYVSPEAFRAQMQALKDWGYTPIPISLLVRAIRQGALLPEHPVVITFDDGDISVYTTAFPIMREFGFVGTNYLVSNRLNAQGYMHKEEILELAQAGWEVGSHSMTHVDLRTSKNARREIEESRIDLEAALGLPVNTFAYPVGSMSPNMYITASYFYSAALGLGPSNHQTSKKLFYLWRRPVDYSWDLETFHNVLLK